MQQLISDIFNPDMPFLKHAFLVGVLASLSFGVIGTFVVIKRMTYIAGSISHSILGGIGLALYLDKVLGYTTVSPLLGAVLVGLLSASLISIVTLRGTEREDTIIGAIWVIGMSLGLIFIAKTPGYIDPMSYLFGNILLISTQDIWFVLGLNILVITISVLFYHKLIAVCFDEGFARIRGIKTNFYYTLLIFLTALTVILLIRVVGIVMVIALLTIPQAIASHFSKKLFQMMFLSVILCAVFVVVGLAASYQWDLPSGPTIIIIAGTAYLISLSFQALSFRIK